uniref:Uncharacterized protein n=1 Tax=Arundo donax TaxID=35708 RepID=A0A0A9HRN6_ARUDO
MEIFAKLKRCIILGYIVPISYKHVQPQESGYRVLEQHCLLDEGPMIARAERDYNCAFWTSSGDAHIELCSSLSFLHCI